MKNNTKGRWGRLRGLSTVLLGVGLALPAAQAATVLTFDITGISDFQNINQNYGDNVSAAADGVGSYGTTNGLYTPNVTVSYGTAGEDPALWTTGYGNLTNVYFNDADGDTTMTVTFTAAPGFLVNLESFDIASFISTGQTLANPAIQVLDGSNNVLWTLAGPFGVTGTTRSTLSPNVSASVLSLVVNLTGLSNLSDDVGLDNITFSQSVDTPSSAVPEPSTFALAGAGCALLGLRRLRRRA